VTSSKVKDSLSNEKLVEFGEEKPPSSDDVQKRDPGIRFNS